MNQALAAVLVAMVCLSCSGKARPATCHATEGPAQLVTLNPRGATQEQAVVNGSGSGTLSVVLPGRRRFATMVLHPTGPLGIMAADQPVSGASNVFVNVLRSGTTVLAATDQAGNAFEGTVVVACG
jgi:hypothetical protein